MKVLCDGKFDYYIFPSVYDMATERYNFLIKDVTAQSKKDEIFNLYFQTLKDHATIVVEAIDVKCIFSAT